MRNTFFSNTLFYFTIVGLYIYEPVLGALGQIGLGIFQFVVALSLMNVIKKGHTISHIHLKIYLRLILAWFLIFLVFIITKFLRNYFIVILYIIPMLIGLYFVVVTYLIHKNQKS